MTKASAIQAFLVSAAAVLLTVPSGAHADPTKCKQGIAKASSKYVQGRTKALQKCENLKTKGVLANSTVCATESKTEPKLQKLDAKIKLDVANACGGADKSCSMAGDNDSLASIGWGGVSACPDFESSGCSNAISDCGDIADCLECVADKAVDQAIALYYASLVQGEFGSNSAVNKCQQAIGKETAKFLNAKSKALQKCWDAALKGTGSTPCPSPGDGKAALAISKAETKKVANICKACGGADRLCDGNADLSPGAIGFSSTCPSVCSSLTGCSICGNPVATTDDLVKCVDCVTEFKVDCVDALAVPEFVFPLPAECNPTTTTSSSTSSSTTDTTSSTSSSTTTTSSSTSSSTTDTTSSTSSSTTTTSSSTSSSTTTTLTALCGNGVREPGEQCDDGNTTNLDGCDGSCQFEQNQRINFMAPQFATDAVCTANAFGGALVGGTLQSQITTAMASDVADGSLTIVLRMLGLQDLSGTLDAAVSVGLLGGSPVAGAGYDGTNDVDWWYTVDPLTIDANRNPLAVLSGSIAAKVLVAGPGHARIGLDFGGGLAPVDMSNATMRINNGAVSTPVVSAGGPPGHLASEQLDPTLQSYQTSGQPTPTGAGELCGNVSASSLSTIPVPSSLAGGGLFACSQNYSAANNSLLDVLVGGCTILFIPQVQPTQPDKVDPNAPVAGAGGPYVLSANASHQVTTCRDKNNVTVTLSTCLNAAAYSSFFKFTTDRVIMK